MQFIKTKIGKVKGFTKTLFTRDNKVSNSPKQLLEHITSHPSEDITHDLYEELADISRCSERNSELADFIVVKLEGFKYEKDVMRTTDHLLSVVLYLLKNGGISFAFDMRNNLAALKELENIDSKHFEGKFNKKAKELDYQLSVIKHRAQYIQVLLTKQNQLQEEREKAAEQRVERQKYEQENRGEIAQTTHGLKTFSQINESSSIKETSPETTSHCLNIPLGAKRSNKTSTM